MLTGGAFALGLGLGALLPLRGGEEEEGAAAPLAAQPALARALFAAGALPLSASDCALPGGGAAPDVAAFLIGYLDALSAPGAQAQAECGGRGPGLCSLSYGVPLGEKTDAAILLFALGPEGRVTEAACLAQ